MGSVSHINSSGLNVKTLLSPAFSSNTRPPSSPSTPRHRASALLHMPSPFSVCLAEAVQDSVQPSVGIQSSQSQVFFKVESAGLYFLRRTAVLILRPAIAGCPAGEEAVKVFAALKDKNHIPIISFREERKRRERKGQLQKMKKI